MLLIRLLRLCLVQRAASRFRARRNPIILNYIRSLALAMGMRGNVRPMCLITAIHSTEWCSRCVMFRNGYLNAYTTRRFFRFRPLIRWLEMLVIRHEMTHEYWYWRVVHRMQHLIVQYSDPNVIDPSAEVFEL